MEKNNNKKGNYHHFPNKKRLIIPFKKKFKAKIKKSKYNKLKYFKIISLIILFIMLLIIFFFKKDNLNNNYGLSFELKMKDYANDSKKFAIFNRYRGWDCGFFSNYLVHLGCMRHYVEEGYIPIVDLQSWPNRYNDKNTSKYNPWELFFYQPYNYTMGEVKQYAKNFEYINCTENFPRPDEILIFFNKSSTIFWHNFADRYMPIRNEILSEVKIIMKNLFGDSKNILGVKLRGTDYKNRPGGHSIQPDVKQVIQDVKAFDKKYKYDFIFFATEDEEIQRQFVPEFKDKIKMLVPDDKYMINFKDKNYQFLNNVKNYFFNVIILSKCLDIISSKTSGSASLVVITNGFRNSYYYNLGTY